MGEVKVELGPDPEIDGGNLEEVEEFIGDVRVEDVESNWELRPDEKMEDVGEEVKLWSCVVELDVAEALLFCREG